MEYTSVSFMSTLRHSMNVDLKLVKNYLAQHIENVSFRYYINDGTKGNYMVKSGLRDKEIKFTDKMDHAICIDPSIPEEVKWKENNGKRILISLPFETQFKALFSEDVRKKDLSAFSHIVTVSSFGSKVLREIYEVGSAQVVENVAAPFAWEITLPSRQEYVKNQFLHYYPGMKNKKVLAVLTTGKIKEDVDNPFVKFDLESFLEELGEDWFLITNNTLLLEQYATLSYKYITSCGFINDVLPPRDLLYFSDALITNSSVYSCYYAAKKKPIFFWETKDSFFKKYIVQNYPELLLNDAEQYSKLADRLNCFSEAQEAFSNEFSYNMDCDPCEKIREIIVR